MATTAPCRDRYLSLDRLLLVITRTMTTKMMLKAVIAPSTHAPDVTPCTRTRHFSFVMVRVNACVKTLLCPTAGFSGELADMTSLGIDGTQTSSLPVA